MEENKIKRESISEEIRYAWECPNCGNYNESSEDPDYEEELYCGGCRESFELED